VQQAHKDPPGQPGLLEGKDPPNPANPNDPPDHKLAPGLLLPLRDLPDLPELPVQQAHKDPPDLLPQEATGPQEPAGPTEPTGATRSKGPIGPQGPAETGTGTTWASIDRPEWTNQFSWSSIGPFISPAETTNFDINTSNSITPVVDKVYNIGQRSRRYNVVHTENLNLTTAIFDNRVRPHTYFSGSYLELRDRPTSVGQPDFYEKLDFFSDKQLSLTTVQTTLYSGLKLNGYFDCKRMQVNTLSVLGG
jgi:hypothetical protein